MCVTCKFRGSVFSYIASAPLAHTTACHAGETYLCALDVCVSFVSVFVFCVCLSEQVCVAEGLNAPAPARAHP